MFATIRHRHPYCVFAFVLALSSGLAGSTFSAPLSNYRPTTDAAPFHKVHLYLDRIAASNQTDHIVVSGYPTSLQDPDLLVTDLDSGGLLARFNSFARDATNLRNTGSGSYVEYEIAPPCYASYLGLLLMTFNVFVQDSSDPCASITVEYEDGDTHFEVFGIGDRLRHHRSGSNSCWSYYSTRPGNNWSMPFWEGGGYFYDVHVIELPVEKRSFRITSVKIEASPITNYCQSIQINGGPRLHGISAWPSFQLRNASGQTVLPQTQGSSAPYGGYVHPTAGLVGDDGQLQNAGCALANMAQLNEFFGAQRAGFSNTPAGLNQWLQRNRGYGGSAVVRIADIPGGQGLNDIVWVERLRGATFFADMKVLVEHGEYTDPIATLSMGPRDPNTGWYEAQITALHGSSHVMAVGDFGRVYRRVNWTKASKTFSGNRWMAEELVGPDLPGLVENELVQSYPVILNVDEGNHWVTATGMTPESPDGDPTTLDFVTGTYSMADPGYSDATELSYRYWHHGGAGNVFHRAIRCRPIAGPAPAGTAATGGLLVVETSGAESIRIEDPSGNVLALDPALGLYTGNIPGFIGGNFTYEDLAGGHYESSGHEIIEIPDPTDGTYRVTVNGSAGTDYTLEIADYDTDDQFSSAVASSTLGGAPARYQVTYSSAPGSITTMTPVIAAAETGPSASLEMSIAPNPMRFDCVMSFRVATRGPVTLEIYDVQGKRVARLADGIREVGDHREHWSGRSASGAPVPEGVYFVRLRNGPTTTTRRVLVVR